MRGIVMALLCLMLSVMARGNSPAISEELIKSESSPAQLSSFGFFAGKANKPSVQLIPYELKTPLFSDYAEKQRFLYVPKGQKISVDPAGRLQFPVGTALIKSFGYPDATGALRILETRLLLNRANGWTALPYVWRADGGDADLKLGGSRIAVTPKHGGGKSTTISYAVPNKNQCKQCHANNEKLMPIGPVVQNMRFLNAKDLSIIPASMQNLVATGPDWQSVNSASLDVRARTYLKVNCGSCHSPKGSASNSGLFLDDPTQSGANYGIGKRPVAAGRGSGGFEFVIDPGQPDQSILLHRMKSVEADVAMPELGRATVHKEATDMISQWIAEMPSAASN